MQKMQILFPDPMMAKLRKFASIEDKNVSEVVRAAVENYLERLGEVDSNGIVTVPVLNLGKLKIKDPDLRAMAYSDRVEKQN